MPTVTLADAKAHLSALVSRAAAGDPVCITRRSKPVARLAAAAAPRQRIDPVALRALTDAMPLEAEPAGALLRCMRDDVRY